MAFYGLNLFFTSVDALVFFSSKSFIIPFERSKAENFISFPHETTLFEPIEAFGLPTSAYMPSISVII
jgi:hypothetical protein